MSQSDTQLGEIVVLAGQSLVGKEGYLVYMTHDTGVPEVKLPASIDDKALYLVIDGAADAAHVALKPLSPARNQRFVLKGACNPGDVLVLADPAVAADAGKVRALPAAAGTYRGLAIAEEKGVEGQYILARPALLGPITIAG